jgi:cobalamin 5'-phosphate synthase/cobalamin synthase
LVFSSLRKGLQSLVVAFQFLTRLPLPVTVPFNETTIPGSVVFFPFAGAIIGLLAATSGLLLQLWIPALPAAVLMLGIWIALSGGLHLDGWMDTADGVLSHRSRERMLEIMKDSRVGAMGVIAGVLLLLFKFSLLIYITDGQQSLATAAHFASVCLWSRWWMAIAVGAWPYARSGEGMGKLYRGVKAGHLLGSTLVAASAGIVIYWLTGMNTAEALEISALWLLLSALFGYPLAYWLNRKLGGLTGDTYGALNEAVEALLLLALVILLKNGFY